MRLSEAEKLYTCTLAKRECLLHLYTPNRVIVPATNPINVQYSFDFAQQVHYPSNPLQPGPIYFLTPRKVAIFGICCEAISQQVNFIIDAACNTGKGANTVVSLLPIPRFYEISCIVCKSALNSNYE